TGGCLEVRDIDGILAGDDAAYGDDLLANRRRDLVAVDDDEIVGAAAIIAVEREKTGFAMPIPGDIADRILDEEIEVVGMVVGPIQRDDEFGLGVNLAVLCIGRNCQQCDEEQECNDLQRLEQ